MPALQYCHILYSRLWKHCSQWNQLYNICYSNIDRCFVCGIVYIYYAEENITLTKCF